MRRFVPLLLSALSVALTIPSVVSAVEWSDTREGAYDWVSERNEGSGFVFNSGHQRNTTAMAACADLLDKNPTWQCRVRSANYRITVKKPPPGQQPPPSTPALGLGFDPTCAIAPLQVKIGTAFVGTALRDCLVGTDKDAATFAVTPAPTGGWAISGDGALSHPGTGPAGSGTFTVQVTTPDLSNRSAGLVFTMNWVVAP